MDVDGVGGGGRRLFLFGRVCLLRVGLGVCVRRLLAGGAGLWDGGPGLVTGLGWQGVVVAAIPSTFLRIITPAQGGPFFLVLLGFVLLGWWVGLGVGPLGPV